MVKNSESAASMMHKHLVAVIEQNKQFNLTAITSLEQGELLHIEDSLAAIAEVNAAPEGPLLDIGSGAGFPGVPLALASGRKTTLVEANKKKAGFLRQFIVDNKLCELINVSDERCEELASLAAGQFAVVVSRAVAELPVLLEYAAPFLFLGGMAVVYKAQLESNEIAQGLAAAKILGFEAESERKLVLSDQKTQRTIATYRKTSEPSILVPRRPGMAKKRPLGR